MTDPTVRPFKDLTQTLAQPAPASVRETTIEDLLPRGWALTVRREHSIETMSWRTKLFINSAPDVVGRVATGMVYVKPHWKHIDLLHAMHHELCRMDATLTHELTLADPLPDTGRSPGQGTTASPGYRPCIDQLNRPIVPGGGHGPVKGRPPQAHRGACPVCSGQAGAVMHVGCVMR